MQASRFGGRGRLPDGTMVSEYDTSFTDEHVYTTDPEAIRHWAEARDAIPVDVGRDAESDADAETDADAESDAAGEEPGEDADAGENREEDTGQTRGDVDDFRFVRRDDHEVADVEESWESFFAAFEDDDRALVLDEDAYERVTDREDEHIPTHEFHPREALTDSPAEELDHRQPPSEDS